MPNIKSAKKRVLVIEKKTLRNQMIKSALKTAIKRFEIAVANKDAEAATTAYRYAVKKLDQAVAKGIVHKNTAARKKSQMALKYQAIAA
ncbi:MAG: 30S ribosomal protein S20 [Clostridia bacterium]|nr:30S ribosomal protein S20 [Oscillospiraceae bacterium]MBQ7034030.1 30S ribosomal protein S20 [Clostridia bacterium]